MRKEKLLLILIVICLVSFAPKMNALAQYGLNGLYGINNFYASNGSYFPLSPTPPGYALANTAFAGVSRTSAVPISSTPVALTPVVPPPPVPIVLVTTNWVGAWYTLNTSASVGPQTGTLVLQLTQNISTGALNGLVDFGATNLVPVPISVTGTLLPGVATFSLDGIFFDPLLGWPANINIVCTLTSSTTMSGTFNIISWKGINIGSFYLTLL